jgi:hypothetical protein
MGPVSVTAQVMDAATVEDVLSIAAAIEVSEDGEGLDYLYRHTRPPPVRIILGASARGASIKSEGHAPGLETEATAPGAETRGRATIAKLNESAPAITIKVRYP